MDWVSPCLLQSELTPPTWALEWSQIVAGLGGIFLSLFLAMLYKRQQEQLAADHMALLEVSDYEWDNNEVTIQLSNFGNGVAARCRLATLVTVDNEEHRRRIVRSNMLKRQDKEGEFASVIQSGEEDIVFTGKSKVGTLVAADSPEDWIGLHFSHFVGAMKQRGVTELKFLHVVQGTELANEVRKQRLSFAKSITINPQEWENEHSLGNLPSAKHSTADDTFDPFFIDSRSRRWVGRIRYEAVRLFNTVLFWWKPFRHRPTDLSGRRPVKRVILARNTKARIKRGKRKFWWFVIGTKVDEETGEATANAQTDSNEVTEES